MLLARLAAARMQLPPIDGPSVDLPHDVMRAWHDIRACAPLPVTACDDVWLEVTARLVSRWRSQGGDRSELRETLRWLGRGLIPMADRRALLFPDRAKAPNGDNL